jgi:hypothetical protein
MAKHPAELLSAEEADLQGQLGLRAQPGQQAHREPQVLQDPQDHREPQELQAHKVNKDPQAHKAYRA